MRWSFGLPASSLAAFVASLVFSGPLMAGHTSAQGPAFSLAPAGCAMAHCNARLSDAVNTPSPSAPRLMAIDPATPGHPTGVGCSSNTTIVACTTGAPQGQGPELVVYDGDGNRLWTDGGLLGPTATASAPLIGADSTVIIADQNSVLRADPISGQVIWQSAKPDTGIPISPVPVGEGMVLLGTSASSGGAPEVSVWDSASGTLLSHAPLVDTVTGTVYATRNTPSVSGNRVYISTAAIGNNADGRLYALNVCNGIGCARGEMSIAWYYAFSGPSGASPLTVGSRIFFDGQPRPGAGSFMAVDDLGTSGSLVWRRNFNSTFMANAPQDPRRGLWVYPAGSKQLLRLDMNTGDTQQQISPGALFSLADGYTPSTCMSMSTSASGATVLTFGIKNPGDVTLPTYAVSVDVSSAASGAPLWAFQVAGNVATNTPSGQFPHVVSPSTGGNRTVFLGTASSTFFIGDY